MLELGELRGTLRNETILIQAAKGTGLAEGATTSG